ncbi:MAG: AMP-binding enzyme, partial [Steroidobacterales bacterium]
VAGVPDAVRGEEIMACVVPRDGAAADRQHLAESIVTLCLERLAYYKAPGYVGFCEELPLTATAKIQRARLKQLGESLLTSGQCVDTRALKRRTASTA